MVHCAHLAAMVWLGRRSRRCRSTIIVSILVSCSGVCADMHAALGHCLTSHSCARFTPGVLLTVHIREFAQRHLGAGYQKGHLGGKMSLCSRFRCLGSGAVINYVMITNIWSAQY